MDQPQHFEITITRAAFALYLGNSEQTRLHRLLKRAAIESRDDDTADIIEKRFQTLSDTHIPVIYHLEKEGRLKKVNAVAGEDEMYAEIQKIIATAINQNMKCEMSSLAEA